MKRRVDRKSVRGSVSALLVTIFTLAAGSCPAAVRVEEDEVFFSVEAPGAAEVFLIGDFNAWNPTVDKMVRINGRFEINLFLDAGTYGYRYLVDGEAIADSDVAETSADGHSVLRLARVGGVLELLPGEASHEGVTGFSSVAFELRYIGRVQDSWKPEDSNGSAHLAQGDFLVDLGDEDIARVTTQWDRSTLGGEEKGGDVVFFSGELGYTLAGWKLRAFDNTPLPDADGPLPLFGSIGIYGFRFGYGVQGASADGRILSAIDGRAFFADRSDSAAPFPLPDLGYLGGWQQIGVPNDTTYALSTSASGGEDIWAFRFGSTIRSVHLGFSYRSNRGSDPSSLVEHSWNATTSNTTIDIVNGFKDTRMWGLDATVNPKGFWKIGLGFLDGSEKLDPREEWSYSGPDTSVALMPAGSTREALELAEGLKLAATFDIERGDWRVDARYEYEEQDSKGDDGTPQVGLSVQRALRAGLGWSGARDWDFEIRAEWLSYGAERQALFFMDPTRSFWLDPNGQLFAPHLWNLGDARRSLLIAPSIEWTLVAPDSAGEGRDGRWLRLNQTTAWGDSRANTFIYRLSGRWDIGEHLFVEGDGRVLSYHGGGLGLEEDYGAWYLEIGARKHGIWEAALGFGVDPWFFNPVVSRYIGWGRDAFLERRGAFGPVGLADYDAFGPIVDAAQRDLEKARLVVLEFRLWF